METPREVACYLHPPEASLDDSKRLFRTFPREMASFRASAANVETFEAYQTHVP